MSIGRFQLRWALFVYRRIVLYIPDKHEGGFTMQFSYFWCNYQSGIIAEAEESDVFIRTHAEELGVPTEVQAGFAQYSRYESLLFYAFITAMLPWPVSN